MENQIEYIGPEKIIKLRDIFIENNVKNIFVVTGKYSSVTSGAKAYLNELSEDFNIIVFNDFSSNPKVSEAKKGLELFNKSSSEMIVAIGGGSTIDVAKLIYGFSNTKQEMEDYFKNEKLDLNIDKDFPFVAVPTTAGTGSEATHFAVIYLEGKKYSFANDNLIPNYVILDPKLIMNVPKNIAASTGLDAFSQALEAYWSINSTEESKEYSKRAIDLILPNFEESVHFPTIDDKEKMLIAANLAGKAINIAKTTAPHAISYQITSDYGVPHGHAVSLTLGLFLEYNSKLTLESCNDPRGLEYVKKTFNEINNILRVNSSKEGNELILAIIEKVGLENSLKNIIQTKEEITKISKEINYERLKNNPRKIHPKEIETILNKSYN